MTRKLRMTYLYAGAIAAVMAFTAAVAAPAAAQPARFARADVEIIAAQRFVREPDGSQFRVGQDLLLNLRDSAAARDFAARGFQIRIFRLDGGWEANPWIYFPPCDVYFSMVVPVGRVGGGRINVARPAITWLEVGDSTLEPGHYLVVFEERSDADPIFRLNHTSQAVYFSRGLKIEVLPPSRITAADVATVSNRTAQRINDVSVRARVNAPTSTCYFAKPALASAEDNALEVAALERC